MSESYPGEYAVLVRVAEADNATLRASLVDLQLRHAAVVVELESLRSWAYAVRAAVRDGAPQREA